MLFTEASIFRINSSRWTSSVCSNTLYAIFLSAVYPNYQCYLKYDYHRNAKLELLVHGLVVPHSHAQPSAYAAADDYHSQQGCLRDAPLGAFGFPLIDAIREEGDDIDGDKIDEYELFDCHSFIVSGGMVDSG